MVSFILHSNLTLHLALILPPGNPLPEFSLSLPSIFIILFLSLFFCGQFSSAPFSMRRPACLQNISYHQKAAIVLPLYHWNQTSTFWKCQSIQLKVECPQESHFLLGVIISKDFPTQVALHRDIKVFSPFFFYSCHFITICTHHGEWTYIHAQTCMMGVGGFLGIFFFPCCSICEGKETKITKLSMMTLWGCRGVLRSSMIFYHVCFSALTSDFAHVWPALKYTWVVFFQFHSVSLAQHISSLNQ